MRNLSYMENEVLKLLRAHANDDYSKNELAPWIAKTSLEMGHLYSDLGLTSRKEMGEFMSKHFTSLAKLKPEDKRWKKYLYDCIGKTAPACATCADISNCFNCSFNPEKKEQKNNYLKTIKEKFPNEKKDLVILLSFEVAIVLISFMFIYK
jgi:nitrogen fixation protein NifQ